LAGSHGSGSHEAADVVNARPEDDVIGFIRERARLGFDAVLVVFMDADGQVTVSAKGIDVTHLCEWMASWWDSTPANEPGVGSSKGH
jgi:hypothetical protein